MTKTEMNVLIEQMADAVVKVLKANVDPLKQQLVELKSLRAIDEARIKGLEDRPSVKYCGIWRDGERYTAGSMTTKSGSLWIAVEDTDLRPGTDASGWKLIVKQGAA